MSSKKSGKPAKGANPVGRPTKYRPEYCQRIVEYFKKPKYVSVVKEVASQGKQVCVVNNEAADMPLFEDFAVYELDVCTETLMDWCEKYPEFLRAYTKCKSIQKSFITTHGVGGKYNASFTKFFAINNLGMKSETHVVNDNTHTVKDYSLGFNLDKTPDEIKKENNKDKD